MSTDKTQLTQFSGGRQAYPVYLTLGNIPHAIRRKPSEQACILIGYLPVEKVAKVGRSKPQLSARYQQLFHAAMTILFEPLVKAGKDGVEMTSGDGSVRRVHPILAAYVADYPEQCLVTCSKYGSCPKCHAGPTELDDPTPRPGRTPDDTLKVMRDAAEACDSHSAYTKICMQQNVNGNVDSPFWENLPFTNIHLSQTPDVLHQLYQGVVKYLILWCQKMMTEEELDRRIRRLPPGLGVQHFKSGISALSQVSGSERKNMGKILLGCVASELPEDALTAVRAILDFIYLAQYSAHTAETLGYMDEALDLWETHKAVFIKVKICTDFNIPKIHSLRHYVASINWFGTMNNYNTEMFERLHIEYAKKGWRASNHRDAFPQMTRWVARQESVHSFERFLKWVSDEIGRYCLSVLMPRWLTC